MYEPDYILFDITYIIRCMNHQTGLCVNVEKSIFRIMKPEDDSFIDSKWKHESLSLQSVSIHYRVFLFITGCFYLLQGVSMQYMVFL